MIGVTIYTVGLTSLYDAGLSRSPGRFGKGGRDERGAGGTVFKELQVAVQAATKSSEATGKLYGVYEIVLPPYAPVSWYKDGEGELLFSVPITRRVL